jgi:hypothetical protein
MPHILRILREYPRPASKRHQKQMSKAMKITFPKEGV